MMIQIPRLLKRLARRILLPPPSPTPKEVQEWSIGIYTGTTAWQIVPADHVINPVLTRHDVTDAKATFVADPFMLSVHGTWHMFFEVMNSITGKGEIALATSTDGLTWKYQQIVLDEPFHLSYPYVFAFGDDYYMVPESWKAGAVRLYRAKHFPTGWSYVSTLMQRHFICDSSVFHFGEHWWMFAEQDAGEPSYCPSHVHVQGPLPPTSEGEPWLQRFSEGLAVNVPPFDEPHSPSIGL